MKLPRQGEFCETENISSGFSVRIAVAFCAPPFKLVFICGASASDRVSYRKLVPKAMVAGGDPNNIAMTLYQFPIVFMYLLFTAGCLVTFAHTEETRYTIHLHLGQMLCDLDLASNRIIHFFVLLFCQVSLLLA